MRVTIELEDEQLWRKWKHQTDKKGMKIGIATGLLLEKAILAELGLEYKTTIKTIVEPGIILEKALKAEMKKGEK